MSASCHFRKSGSSLEFRVCFYICISFLCSTAYPVPLVSQTMSFSVISLYVCLASSLSFILSLFSSIFVSHSDTTSLNISAAIFASVLHHSLPVCVPVSRLSRYICIYASVFPSLVRLFLCHWVCLSKSI